MTWALQEATYLLNDLVPRHSPERSEATDSDLLNEAFAEVPSIPLEEGGARIGVSPSQLTARTFFWTVDSAFFISAEALVKEVPAAVAISTLGKNLGNALILPDGPVAAIPHSLSIPRRLALMDREVDRIVVHRDQRRVDLRWTKVSGERTWIPALPRRREARHFLQRAFEAYGGRRFRRSPGAIFVAKCDVEREGLNSETAIASMDRTFVLPGTPYANYLVATLERVESAPNAIALGCYAIALLALQARGYIGVPDEFIRREMTRLGRETPYGLFDVEKDPDLVKILQETDFRIFDPQDWSRDHED